MSILIKGMEMPTDCIFCPMFHGAWTICAGLNKTTSVKGRPDDCPLVPVPPHGALIDRDDFFAACPELVDGYKTITDELVVLPAEEGE